MRKLLLNCDQVFDLLTRGPFPSGEETDQPVESHLQACHECRQLAEALQPAVHLLHESLSERDCQELPRYQGILSALAEEGVAPKRSEPVRGEIDRIDQGREL